MSNIEHQRKDFEAHWLRTRGQKKAARELERRPDEPMAYRCDSANRHWVTWQAAIQSHNAVYVSGDETISFTLADRT